MKVLTKKIDFPKITIEFKCDLAWNKHTKEKNLICVSSRTKNHLVCFHCGTNELYHDAHAWYFSGSEKEGDDLICETCEGRSERTRCRFE